MTTRPVHAAELISLSYLCRSLLPARKKVTRGRAGSGRSDGTAPLLFHLFTLSSFPSHKRTPQTHFLTVERNLNSVTRVASTLLQHGRPLAHSAFSFLSHLYRCYKYSICTPAHIQTLLTTPIGSTHGSQSPASHTALLTLPANTPR